MKRTRHKRVIKWGLYALGLIAMLAGMIVGADRAWGVVTGAFGFAPLVLSLRWLEDANVAPMADDDDDPENVVSPSSSDPTTSHEPEASSSTSRCA
jgi:hypothetical protein